MPELPEVETIRRGLECHLPGKLINGFEVGDRKVLQFSPEVFAGRGVGQRICGLGRRGKFLSLHLERDVLIVHLGMTGQLTLRYPERPDSKGFLRHEVTGLQRVRQHRPDQHTHFQLRLEDGCVLMYRDIRKFGKLWLLERDPEKLERFHSHLGLEPFSDQYSLEPFLKFMDRRKTRVKSLLLDQRFVAGVGNIYADEALFEAGIHPARKVRYLKKSEKEKLFTAIPFVLEKGIRYGGTTLRDYINSDGEAGGHQEYLNVYGREGEACLRCRSAIRKIVVGQRGTHFCPCCQKR